MTLCTFRVELHGASHTDYANLSEQLARHSITDIVQADSGKWYKLPPSEYSYIGNATLDEVYDTVKSVTETLGKQFAVLASEVTRRSWIGLEKM